MRRRSVRVRITAIATGLTLVVLVIVGAIVVVVAQRQLDDNLDRSLEQRADEVAASIDRDLVPGIAGPGGDDDRFVQVLDADGEVLASSAGVAGLDALAPIPSGEQEFVTRDDLPIEDDVFRVLIRRVELGNRTVHVVVGENVDDVHDAVRAMVVAIVVAFPVAAVLLAGAVWWLVGRTLRPVERMRSEVEAIGLADLDHRVPVPGTGDEIDRLAGTMNEMLERLESASARQRRFVADVSHELRTPLTRMRTSLEVDLAHPGADIEATARAALGDAIEMQHLVDDLLFLARRDAGRATTEHTPVDLDVVVDREVRRLRDEIDDGPTIDMSGVGAAVVAGDGVQLTRLVRNLLTNAARYASSSVIVTVTEDDAGVLLVVADDGPGVPAGDRERIFERFVRLDEARSARDGGTGLGLAIVRDIAEAHGAIVEVGESLGGGARFDVRFPA